MVLLYQQIEVCHYACPETKQRCGIERPDVIIFAH